MSFGAMSTNLPRLLSSAPRAPERRVGTPPAPSQRARSAGFNLLHRALHEGALGEFHRPARCANGSGVNSALRAIKPRSGLALRAWTMCLLLLLGAASAITARAGEVTVATDGSGQFKSVQEAIMAGHPTSATNWGTVRIKPGTYKELIYVQRERGFLRLIGESPTNTIITFDLHANLLGRDNKPIGTFRTPTAQLDADNIVAENLTFENSAGPVGQALAIRLDGDRLTFRNCRFLGCQDTIFANRGRHYFENCHIEGTVDFIFGAATSWFEGCEILCVRDGYVTAPSTPASHPFGFVFNRCTIRGGSPEVKTFLGRPWRAFGSTTYLNTEMSAGVRPTGWNNWGDPPREKTSRFAEFDSKGPGADPAARVPWARKLSDAEARALTVKSVLGGADGWNPARVTETASAASEPPFYLFATFNEPATNGLRFAYSFDGYHWTNIPGVFLAPQVGPSRLLRDPSLLRGPDGTFHLVWTTGWRGDQGFGYSCSPDLVHWRAQQFIPVMTNEPTACNVWAPELFYDAAAKEYIITWASTIPGRFPDGLEPRTNNHRMYFTRTPDFRSFSPSKLFLDPGFSVIDCQIVKASERFVLLLKDNSRPQRNIRVAYGDSPLGPWRDISPPFTGQFTEGPCALQVGEDWLVFYEAYQAHRYQAAKTRDFKTFTDVSAAVAFPPDHKHGTALRVPRAILDGLLHAGAATPDNSAASDLAEAQYQATLEKRAADILAALNLNDPAKEAAVRERVIAQYRALRAWNAAYDPMLKGATADAAKAIRATRQPLHERFLADLAEVLTPGQVEVVKDKLTYGKVKVTYDAYCAMVPTLSDDQRARILATLKEAREEAMDEGSSEEKSAVFNRYKGRINNFLSKEGVDMGKASKEWAARQKDTNAPAK